MKPAFMTKFGPEEGNCWEACIASILEMDINEIPQFVPDYQIEETIKWLQTMNYGLAFFINSSGMRADVKISNDVYYIVGGKSPRDKCLHAVVFKNGEMVHDPHPDGKGILSRVDYTIIFKNST